MLRAIRYELKPTKAQAEMIRRFCGCCRFIFNRMLDKRKKLYEESKESVSAYDQILELPALKKAEETCWLSECPAQALQQAILDLECAYKNFFRRVKEKKVKPGFPKFRKKGVRDRYRIPVACKIDFEQWLIQLPKLGWVKIYRGHNKTITGKVHQCTVSCTSTGRYFVSVLYECEDRTPLENGKSVGIDVGVKSFAVLSTGEVIENQKYLTDALKRLRVLQRAMARKYQKDKKVKDQSRNWHKARLQVAKLHERIRNRREDFLQKLTTRIARHYSVVCIEDLNVQGMMANHHLARAISDCGWRRFVTMLEYKCDRVERIDRFFASSQTCYKCGTKNPKVKNLSVREWTCPQCGTRHDRDLNAAKNIEREGLSRLACNTGLPVLAKNPRL